MAHFIRVQSIEPLEPPVMRVRFTNGEQRDMNLAAYIASGAIFEPVRNDAAYFRSAEVEGGTIAWPNGADIDPDVLFYEGTPPWAQEDAIQTGQAHH